MTNNADDAQNQNSSEPFTKGFHAKSVTFATMFFCCLFTILFLIFFFHLILGPTFYKYIGMADSYIIKKPESIKDPLMLHNIGEMISTGTILSLDDFWSFQSNLYQVLITLLIAINGIIAAFSFFIIKTSSINKAREEAKSEAVNEMKKYIESTAFNVFLIDVVNKKSEQVMAPKVKAMHDDLSTLISSAQEILVRLESDELIVKKLKNDNQEFSRVLKVIAQELSMRDKADSEGSGIVLGDKENGIS